MTAHRVPRTMVSVDMPPHEVRVIDCCDIWMAPTTHGGHGRRSCLPVSLRGAAQENTNLCNQCILHTTAFTFCCNFYILVHRQHRASLLAQRGTETHMSRSRSCFFGLHYTVNSQEAKKACSQEATKICIIEACSKTKRAIALLRAAACVAVWSQSQSSYHKLEVRPKIS
jgi:hypothetical protein